MTTISRYASIIVTTITVALCSELRAAIVFHNFGPGDAFGRVMRATRLLVRWLSSAKPLPHGRGSVCGITRRDRVRY